MLNNKFMCYKKIVLKRIFEKKKVIILYWKIKSNRREKARKEHTELLKALKNTQLNSRLN